MKAPLLKINGLSTWLDGNEEIVRAIEDLSIEIGRGETFALLGESGCGKSMTALSVMRLLPDTGEIVGGTVELDGVDLLAKSEKDMRDVRGRRVAMIFQEPMLSLNPVMTVGAQIAETLARHSALQDAALNARVIELLNAVGIPDPARRCGEYPFQLSGGMKQRVMIAIALACNPKLLIADEPTTALDVTIQAQILDLLMDLRDEFRMAIMIITHNMGVIAETADRVLVMYAGRVIEEAPVARVFDHPVHPYTRGLLECVPSITEDRARLIAIPGTLPDPARRPPGCRYSVRCRYAQPSCSEALPPLILEEADHWAACLRAKELAAS